MSKRGIYRLILSSQGFNTVRIDGDNEKATLLFQLDEHRYIEITLDGDELEVRSINERGPDTLYIKPVVSNVVKVGVSQ